MDAPTKILILHPSTFVTQLLRDRVLSIHPAAACVLAASVDQAQSVLAVSRVGLFVVGLQSAEGDVLDMLQHLVRGGHGPDQTLVVAESEGVRALLTLQRLNVHGVLNLQMEPHNFVRAVAAMAADRSYWSQCYADSLESPDAQLVLFRLTPGEQLALSLMADACSDKVAADRLGMKLCTVRSLRQDLYAKLVVHDKEGLQRAAVRLGFARASTDGIVPLGAARVMLEYVECSQRPTTLSPSVFERHGFKSAKNPFGSNPPFRKSG